jgi:predicted RND superfamily exporter protein
MPLNLNQFLFLGITIAVVVAVTFLVTLLIQLRRTAKEAEDTLNQIGSLVGDLRETNMNVQTKIEDVGEIVEASKKTAASISEIAWFLTTKILRPTSKYWPFIFPLIRFGWRQVKKRKKEEKNV